MMPAREPRYIVGAYYLVSGVLMLCSVVAIWATHYTVLMDAGGRDADYGLWILRAYRTWANPLDVTSMNPLQGMTSMLVAINPLFNPGAWIWTAGWPDSAKHVASALIYFLEVTSSAFVLARALGFSPAFSFAASTWLVILLFPPFNGLFGLLGWLATNPAYGHALALSNLILAILTTIGANDRPGRFVKALTSNTLRATGVLFLLIAILVAAPFYNAGMLIGSCIAATLLVLSSQSWPQLFWRIASGLFILACLYAGGVVDFYAGTSAYAARFAGAPGYLNVDPAAFLCSAGVLCNRLEGAWPLTLTGSHWLHVAAIVGGLAAFRETRSRLGLLFAAMWFGLIAWWVLIANGLVRASYFSPLYFYFMMYPLIAIFSLFALRFLFVRLVAYHLTRKKWMTPVVVATGTGVMWVLLALAYEVAPSKVRSGLLQYASHGSSDIVQTLRKEIALSRGQSFRGSVATVVGAPGGSLRRALGLPSAGALTVEQQAAVLQLAAQSGSSHDLLDLWWRAIPTLSEYGQGVSVPLTHYISKFLTWPGDLTSVNYAIPMRIDLNVLRAMGVRFLVSDVELAADTATRIRSIPAGKDAFIHLYELRNANLGTFSPTQLSPFRAADFFARVAHDPNLLERQAFSTLPSQTLTAARDSRMVFEKRGLHISATSDGTSALLLPIQFSHCYAVLGPSSDKVKVVRANGLHTLIIFERSLDLRLRWRFSFWQNSGCRLRDAAELRSLGLL